MCVHDRLLREVCYDPPLVYVVILNESLLNVIRLSMIVNLIDFVLVRALRYSLSLVYKDTGDKLLLMLMAHMSIRNDRRIVTADSTLNLENQV